MFRSDMTDAVDWVSYLVIGVLSPIKPLAITSGLKDTFIIRYIVERTNKAEISPEEQSEKTELSEELME